MMEAKEACGVFGVYAPGRSVAHLTFDGLYALQHRGQESAGMAVSDGDVITVMKDMGLVTTVFDERKLSGLRRPPRPRAVWCARRAGGGGRRGAAPPPPEPPRTHPGRGGRRPRACAG